MKKEKEESANDFNSAHDKELEAAKSYTSEQQAKLEKINKSLGRWKRKTLTGKELNAIKEGKELPIE